MEMENIAKGDNVMTAIQTIESQDLTIDKLFEDFYIVPDYQREYVWEEIQVEQLINDIYAEFLLAQTSGEAEYFIGGVVVCTKPDRVFELIDGQQRMTTIYIILCAIRDFLHVCKAPPISTLASKIAWGDVDSDGNDIFRYRVELQYEDSGDILKVLADESDDISAYSSETRSIKNIKNAYQVTRTFLKREFAEDIPNLRKFYSFFTKKVKLIRIRTQSITHALKIFETINDRGKGLDSMDLLKNLMFMQAKPEKFERLKERWKKLVDTLYNADEKPLRFLRYYIFAAYNVEQLKEEDIYDWFKKNEDKCQYHSDPIGFINELLIAANAYKNFINGKNELGNSNRYLENLRYLSGSAKQHLILLLAGRDLPEDCFTELCRQVENLFFVYIITRENTREFERKFALWSSELRSVNNHEELDAFIIKRFEPAKQELSARFDLTFKQLDSLDLQRYRIRYLLGKLTQYINEQAFGSSGSETDLKTFVNKKVHLEHILPEIPSIEASKEFGKPDLFDSYVYRLGNLALVEEPINTSLGNKPFSEKKVVYPSSKFLLTRVISKKDNIGHTQIDIALQGMEPFETWTPNDIDNRQRILGQLACRVWGMPSPPA